MLKIGIILPITGHHWEDQLLLAAEERGVNLILGSGSFEKALESAERLLGEHGDISVFMARSNSALFLRQRLKVPVVSFEVSNFDIAKAVSEVGDQSGKFLHFSFSGDTNRHDFEAIAQVTGIDLRVCPVPPSLNVDFNGLADKMGCEKVITSVALIANSCRAGGKQVILTHMTYQEILGALNQGIEVAKTWALNKQKIENLTLSIESFGDGLIGIDDRERIVICNKVMCSILGLAEDDLTDVPLNQARERYSFIENIFSVPDNGILEYNGESYSVQRADPLASGAPVQELLRIISIPFIQKMESAFRKKQTEKGFVAKSTFGDIVSSCAAMETLKSRAKRYARTDSNILLLGESGTGKDILAQSIHNASRFREGPFVAVNCAALPEALLESELFGYEEGAFTGARKGGRTGLIELSHGGTLFLDEIGLMPLSLQAKLLRVLQERQIYRVGGSRLIPIHNRIICATNRDLMLDVEEGLFREDLYYRIDVLSLSLPPLRERGEDIKRLVRQLLWKGRGKAGRVLRISEDTLDEFLTYDWPGNIRQLAAFVERLLILSDGLEVERTLVVDLLSEARRKGTPPNQASVGASEPQAYTVAPGSLKAMERQLVLETYERSGQSISATLDQLGISRTTLWRKLNQSGLDLPQGLF